LLAVDVIGVAFATLGALYLRDNLEYDADRFRALLPYLAISVAVSIPVLVAFGMHRAIWRLSALQDHLRSVGAISIIVLAATSVGFVVNRLEGVARSLPVIQALLMTVFFVGARVAARLYPSLQTQEAEDTTVVAQAMGNARQQDTVLVVGVNRIAELYLRSVAELAPERVRIAGLLGHDGNNIGQIAYGLRVLGGPEDLSVVLDSLEVHGLSVNRIAVMVSFDQLSAEAREALLDAERRRNIELNLISEMIGIGARSGGRDRASQLPAVLDDAEIKSILDRPYWKVKRCIDAVTAAILLILTAPLFVLVGVVVVLDVGFPALFWQLRPGRFGYAFRLLKFRSMSNSHDRAGRRIPDSKRSSLVGRTLRRFRLDELPQLLNILTGKMSLVGPRPLLPVDQPEWDFTRLLVRPGLTGWAQVNGGRFVSVSEKAALDIWYVRNASFRLDMQILLRTIALVLRGEERNEAAIDVARKAIDIDCHDWDAPANAVSESIEDDLPVKGQTA
jgi:lipopolysaccharide/colanic/teichoic acid biosynthesis glycosyltransferase